MCGKMPDLHPKRPPHSVCHEKKLTPGNYKFYEKSSNSQGSSGCSTEYMEYFLTPDPGSPPEPKALSVESPNPGFLTKPVIRVFGVIPGNKVTVHKDKFCTTSSSLEMRVEDGKSYIDITYRVASGTSVYGKPGDHVIYAKTTNFYGSSRCSKASVTYTLKRPDPPTTLSLVTPSPGTNLPVIRVSGVSPGDWVKLYKDSQCSESSVGYATVPDNATSVDIKTTLLPIPGTFTFYAKFSSNTTLSSDCSPIGVTYEYQRN